MMHVRGYLEYRGGYHDKCEDIMSTVGVFSTMEGYHEYRGGYLEYRGDTQYHGGCHDSRRRISWVPVGMFSAIGGYHPL